MFNKYPEHFLFKDRPFKNKGYFYPVLFCNHDRFYSCPGVKSYDF